MTRGGAQGGVPVHQHPQASHVRIRGAPVSVQRARGLSALVPCGPFPSLPRAPRRASSSPPSSPASCCSYLMDALQFRQGAFVAIWVSFFLTCRGPRVLGGCIRPAHPHPSPSSSSSRPCTSFSSLESGSPSSSGHGTLNAPYSTVLFCAVLYCSVLLLERPPPTAGSLVSLQFRYVLCCKPLSGP